MDSLESKRDPQIRRREFIKFINQKKVQLIRLLVVLNWFRSSSLPISDGEQPHLPTIYVSYYNNNYYFFKNSNLSL